MKLLKENPDHFIMDGKVVRISADDIPFAYFQNKLVVGRPGSYHSNIDEAWYTIYKNLPFRDLNFKFPGRIFVNQKVITFWEYPNKNEIKRIINEIEKMLRDHYNLNYNIWNTFKIEVIKDSDYDVMDYKVNLWEPKSDGSEFIPLKDYTGSKDIERIPHLMNWKQKDDWKKRMKNTKIGSKKPVPGAKSGEVPAQTRFRTRKGLGDGIIKLKDLIKGDLK